jgi:hypothetical protein
VKDYAEPHVWGVVITVDGGPGSGNFGHAGRPGKVGGSSGSSRVKRAAVSSQSSYDKLKSKVSPDFAESIYGQMASIYTVHYGVNRELRRSKGAMGQGVTDKDIERYLSGERPKVGGDMKDRDEILVHALDRSFEKYGVAVDEDTVFYRRANEEGLIGSIRGSTNVMSYTLNDFKNAQFTDYGFVSTSGTERGLKAVKKGASSNYGGPTSVRVVVPKGTKVLPLESVAGANKNQAEVLLPRGSTFKTSDVELGRNKRGDLYLESITLTLVDESGKSSDSAPVSRGVVGDSDRFTWYPEYILGDVFGE